MREFIKTIVEPITEFVLIEFVLTLFAYTLLVLIFAVLIKGTVKAFVRVAVEPRMEAVLILVVLIKGAINALERITVDPKMEDIFIVFVLMDGVISKDATEIFDAYSVFVLVQPDNREFPPTNRFEFVEIVFA